VLVDPADRRLGVSRSRWGTHADGMLVRSAVAVPTALTKKDAPDRAAGKDTQTGRIDWQQAELYGTGQLRPALPR
jgi:hypothetical protein